MSDKVRPIREDVTASEGKQHFLDTVAQAYDKLAADGKDPVALVYSLVNESGGCLTGYHTLSAINGSNSLHVARALYCLDVDKVHWSDQYD